MDALQILEKVNSFYSESFSHLLTITIAILGFSGIVIPLIIQYLQNRSVKSENKILQNQISNEIIDAQQKLKARIDEHIVNEKDTIRKLFENEIKSLNTSIEEKFSVAKAGTFMVQGSNRLSNNLYADAARDFAFAAVLYYTGKDDLNGQRALTSLIKNCVPHLEKNDFIELPELKYNTNYLLGYLTNNNKNNRFFDSITVMEKLLVDIK